MRRRQAELLPNPPTTTNFRDFVSKYDEENCTKKTLGAYLFRVPMTIWNARPRRRSQAYTGPASAELNRSCRRCRLPLETVDYKSSFQQD